MNSVDRMEELPEVVDAELAEESCVDDLSPRHLEIARRLIAGQRPKDICREMGFTPAWLSTVTHSPLFKKRLAELGGALDAELVSSLNRLKGLSHEAVDIVQSVLCAPMDGSVDLRLQLGCAWDLLDKVVIPRSEAANPSPHITTEGPTAINIYNIRDEKVLDKMIDERLKRLEAMEG